MRQSGSAPLPDPAQHLYANNKPVSGATSTAATSTPYENSKKDSSGSCLWAECILMTRSTDGTDAELFSFYPTTLNVHHYMKYISY
jgi:hypothetical protein